ncbi:MAG: acetamidase/formamidase family protein [Candidatus Bathyarchaeia archaeon]
MESKVHYLSPDKIHYKWDNSLTPALKVESGDTVAFDMREVSDGQVTPNSKAENLLKSTRPYYPLAGPVYIENAEEGDTLEVDILSLELKNWGWSAIFVGSGLLPEDFPSPYLKHWDLSNHKTTELRPGVVVPLEPFCGTMGVAPKEKGPFHAMPPTVSGGNMDIRHLTAGSVLLLPVSAPGALFSCGDCHAAQGDGEVCVTGIEAPMRATLKFNLRKRTQIPSPQFITKGPLTRKYDAQGYYATTGIAPDLMSSTKTAVRNMIQYLTKEYSLSREEAYILCSVAADLKISEVVDRPNWIVSCYIPASIFI